ncbi:hypothetical protein [Streptomyces sp. NPDC088254]|uniref:hypothetical protein n=1 Tax=Streptomyces sp. NPDC088254 TaxID=3365847 RepID=UPI00382A586B
MKAPWSTMYGVARSVAARARSLRAVSGSTVNVRAEPPGRSGSAPGERGSRVTAGASASHLDQ